MLEAHTNKYCSAMETEMIRDYFEGRYKSGRVEEIRIEEAAHAEGQPSKRDELLRIFSRRLKSGRRRGGLDPAIESATETFVGILEKLDSEATMYWWSAKVGSRRVAGWGTTSGVALCVDRRTLTDAEQDAAGQSATAE